MPQVNQIPWTLMYLSFFSFFVMVMLFLTYEKISFNFAYSSSAILFSEFMDF